MRAQNRASGVARVVNGNVPAGAGQRIRLEGFAAAPWGAAARCMALRDFRDGISAWRLWLLLARRDIRHRYRRSTLGPFWLTLSVGAMVAALGLVYGTLLGMPLGDYLPYLSLGLIIWAFIAGLVGDGCTCLIEADHHLRQARLPRTLFVFRIVARNLVILAHNLLIYVLVALWFQVPVGLWSLAAVPALGVLCIVGAAAALLLGLVSARFRDVPQIVAMLMQVLFFVTPILFQPAMLGSRAWLIDWNPAAHLVAIVRDPLLGRPPDAASWAMALATAAIALIAAFLMLVRYRPRLSYWL